MADVRFTDINWSDKDIVVHIKGVASAAMTGFPGNDGTSGGPDSGALPRLMKEGYTVREMFVIASGDMYAVMRPRAQ